MPCQEFEPDPNMPARELLSKKKMDRQCQVSAAKPVTLEGSQVWRIVQDKRIDLGRLAGKFALRRAPATADGNALRHDAAGVVSVRRGGGSFDFTVAPAPNPALDGDNVVFGAVVEGLDIVDRLNRTPVKQYAGGLGGDGGGDSRQAACYYGSNNAFCGVNKPLQKIYVLRAGLL